MDEKTFMIVVDLRDNRIDFEKFKLFIKQNSDFTAWWNHMPSLYLVQSRLSADDISDQVEQNADGARFLVMEVNPANSQGWMPERSWNWITNREKTGKSNRQQVR